MYTDDSIAETGFNGRDVRVVFWADVQESDRLALFIETETGEVLSIHFDHVQARELSNMLDAEVSELDEAYPDDDQ